MSKINLKLISSYKIEHEIFIPLSSIHHIDLNDLSLCIGAIEVPNNATTLYVNALKDYGVDAYDGYDDNGECIMLYNTADTALSLIPKENGVLIEVSKPVMSISTDIYDNDEDSWNRIMNIRYNRKRNHTRRYGEKTNTCSDAEKINFASES